MPFLDAVYQARQPELVVIGVGIQDGEAQIRQMVQSMGLSFPAVWDGDGTIAYHFKVGLLPTTVFIRPDGSVHTIVQGELNEALLQEILQEMGLP